jgi:nitrite reductase/ring-hydroxylating ferredoxin subunit
MSYIAISIPRIVILSNVICPLIEKLQELVNPSVYYLWGFLESLQKDGEFHGILKIRGMRCLMEKLVELERLKKKQKMRVPYKNRHILLVYVKDQVYGIDDKCPHMGTSLYPGKLEEDVIYCKDHRLAIDVKTGEVANKKQADFMGLDDYSRSVKKYPVFVEDGIVFIK